MSELEKAAIRFGLAYLERVRAGNPNPATPKTKAASREHYRARRHLLHVIAKTQSEELKKPEAWPHSIE